MQPDSPIHNPHSRSPTMIERPSNPHSDCDCDWNWDGQCQLHSVSISTPPKSKSNRKSISKFNSNPNPNPTLNLMDEPKPKLVKPNLMVCRTTARTDEPTPWLMSKIAIPVVLGTLGYSAYVFLATLLVPSLAHSHSQARLSSAEAIALSLSLCLTWLIFLWSYLRVCLTPAGFVSDHQQPSSPPPNLLSPNPSMLTTSSLSPAVPYSHHPFNSLSSHPDIHPPSNPPIPSPPDSLPHTLVVSPRQSTEHAVCRPDLLETSPAVDSPLTVARGLAVVSPAETLGTSVTQVNGVDEQAKRTFPMAEAAPLPLALNRPPSRSGSAERREGSVVTKEEHPPSPGPPSPPRTCNALFLPPKRPKLARPTSSAPSGSLARIPPSVDIHDPAMRYCRKCRTVKCLRAHHCRHCGTCVLKMDHHCPWVGRCVGARNYKFFYNFLQWSTIYCTHIFLVLLIVNVRTGRPQGGVNRHHAAILALSGLFMLFTGSLLLTHTYLIMHNLSTIEHLAIERLCKREKRAIARALGAGERGRWWTVTWETRKVVKRLDEEWGTFVRQGNVWFLGWRKNWESVMGSRLVGWILPIRARPRRDANEQGTRFDVNPRCDDRGRWRPRKEWPVELQ